MKKAAAPNPLQESLEWWGNAPLRLISGAASPAELLGESGFPNSGAFSKAFRHHHKCLPADLTTLGAKGQYSQTYPELFHVGETLNYLGRNPDNLAERMEGSIYRRHFPVRGRTVLASVELRANDYTLCLEEAASPEEIMAIHHQVRGLLGLTQSLEDFYQRLGEHPVMGALQRQFQGVRIPQLPNVWEALCWAVIGQQINLTFAYRLRNRFIALGAGVNLELDPEEPPRSPIPFPSPEQVLKIPEHAWPKAQFSRQKTKYLLGLAGEFAKGNLNQDLLETQSAQSVQTTLLAQKGLGPWSVAYALLRALGQMDALPVGDAGLRTALRLHFKLESQPDAKTQEALMEPFRPYRGLATYYLWKSLSAERQE